MPEANCAICYKIFKTVASLMKHYFDEHQAKYMCKFCTAQFSDQATLTKHTLKGHTEKSRYVCRLCSLYSSKETTLQAHYERHREKKGHLYCRRCDIWFVDNYAMNVHVAYIHYRLSAPIPTVTTPRSPFIPVFKCQFCLKSFHRRFDYCSHSIIVHGAYTFCSFCEKQFESKEQVLKHSLDFHKRMKSFTCVYCWVNFNSKNSLRAHQKTNHRILRCPRCHVLAPSADCLAIHRQYEDAKASRATELQIPREMEPTISAPRNADMLLCLVCFIRVPAESFYEHTEDHLLERHPLSCNEHFEFLFKSDSIKRHVTCFRKEASRGLTMKQDPDGPSVTVTCEQCGFKAEDDNHLSRHRAWCHNIKSCRQCSQEIIGRIGTKLHEAEHGIPFWPDEMQRSDGSKSDLRNMAGTPRSDSPVCSNIPLTKGDAELSAQFPLKGSKRKFQPDISYLTSINRIQNESSVAKKSDKSPKPGHSNSKNVDLMTDDSNKSIADKKTPFFEAVTQIKEEVLSDDYILVEKEEEVRPPHAEFSENTSVTPKPKKRMRVSTSFNETARPSNAMNMAAAAAVSSPTNINDTLAVIQTNNNNCNENSESDSGSLDAGTDLSDDDEPIFTYSRSAKIIPVATALNRSRSKKIEKSCPFISPAEENMQQTPSSNSVLKETRYVCKLCNQDTLYPKSVRRHLNNIHRIPLPNVAEFMEIKEVEITLDRTKKRVKTNAVECQGQFDCPECTKKDKEIKKLKASLKKIKNAASQIEDCLV